MRRVHFVREGEGGGRLRALQKCSALLRGLTDRAGRAAQRGPRGHAASLTPY
jgi:hypothetical protein